jgi:hypothetical protein
VKEVKEEKEEGDVLEEKQNVWQENERHRTPPTERNTEGSYEIEESYEDNSHASGREARTQASRPLVHRCGMLLRLRRYGGEVLGIVARAIIEIGLDMFLGGLAVLLALLMVT